MKHPTLFIIISFLLSSCGSGNALPVSSVNSTATLVPSSTITPSPVPARTVLPTPPALPVGITLQIGEGVVTQTDISEITEALGIIHSYFMSTFGADATLANPLTVRIIGVGANNQAPGDLKGQCCGHLYGGMRGLFFDVQHPIWLQGDVHIPENPYMAHLHDVAHEYTHDWQNAQGCFSNAGSGNAAPMRQWISEGMAEYFAAAGLVNAGKLTWDQADKAWQIADAQGAPYTQFPSLKTMEFGFQGWDYSFAYLAIERLVKQSPKGVFSLRDMCRDGATGMTYSKAFQDAFGQSVDSFYAEFPVYAQKELGLSFSVQKLDKSACQDSVSSGDFTVKCLGRLIPDNTRYGIQYRFEVSGFDLYSLPNEKLGLSSNCNLGGWGTASPTLLDISINAAFITQRCTLVVSPKGSGKSAQVTFSHVNTSTVPSAKSGFDNSFCADFVSSGDFRVDCIGRNFFNSGVEYLFKVTGYDISGLRENTPGVLTSNCQIDWAVSSPTPILIIGINLNLTGSPIKCTVNFSPPGSGKTAQFTFAHSP
jgi:hypothetical protein